MEEPQITTIIPTFRRPALLRRAIDSVLRQTFRNFRLCIYDNASGDETAEIVAQFARRDSRVKYHCHAENIGAGANFNYGLARVDTPYFSFLSDDDILLPEFYETTLADYRRFPDAGFVAGSVIVMSDAGEVLAVPLEEWPREGFFAAPEGLLDLVEHKLPVWTSILFRKAAADPVGGLDEEVGGASDFDYQMKVACRSGFAVSRKACGIFVSHADSYTGNLKFSTFWPGWMKMAGNIEAHPALPQPIRDGARRGLVRYITTTLFSIGLKLARTGNCPDARRAAGVLREHFGERVRALVLAAAASMCGAGSMQARCYCAAYDAARTLRRVLSPRRAQLEKRYGALRKWLGTAG